MAPQHRQLPLLGGRASGSAAGGGLHPPGCHTPARGVRPLCILHLASPSSKHPGGDAAGGDVPVLPPAALLRAEEDPTLT